MPGGSHDRGGQEQLAYPGYPTHEADGIVFFGQPVPHQVGGNCLVDEISGSVQDFLIAGRRVQAHQRFGEAGNPMAHRQPQVVDWCQQSRPNGAE